MGEKGPRIKASAARAHTRRSVAKSRSFSSGLAGLVFLPLAFAIVAWVSYQAVQPPPGKICGTPGGPPVTGPRVQLRDGRYLAYFETGVAKEEARYRIILVHGYSGSRFTGTPGLSKDYMTSHGIYILSYDRAGYGESTPNPVRDIESEAYDVQDLADALDLGPTFYAATISMGGYTGWSLVKYLPHRLAGLVMFCPVVNFWWPGVPDAETKAAFDAQKVGDRLALRVAHYLPWLTYWYMTQTWFPTSSTVIPNPPAPNSNDAEAVKAYYQRFLYPVQQGVCQSKFQDMKVMFGNWDFYPGQLQNPFANSSASVHIWQGDMDYLVPVVLQRYIHHQLDWVNYHEVPGAGHNLFAVSGLLEKALEGFLSEKRKA